MSWIRFFATGLKVGLIPRAPGTFGTLLALPLAFLVNLLPPGLSMLVTGGFVFVAIWVCERNEKESGTHDPGEVVIDEVAGFLITMLWLPTTWPFYLAGFLLFRTLDILKPFPISIIDQRLKGGVGVVMDDVAAGLAANVILQILFIKTTWLGVQWHPL